MSLMKLIFSVHLIDPVPFKLFHSDLMFNFVHRIPESAVEFLIHWLVSKELYISGIAHPSLIGT